MTRPAARVAAVVVNYNAAELLRDCVRSLRLAGVEDVVVVDNDSRDDSRRVLAAADAEARFVATGANLGFGRGANRGVALVDSEYVLVCNPDVTVEEHAVDLLAAALDRDPGLALVGPRIVNTDGSTYPSPRAFPSLRDAAGHAFLGIVAPRNRFTRRYRLLDLDRDEPCTGVDWVSGSCFLARRTAWDMLCGFDEAFFMYAEDVDLCRRAHDAGWRVGFEPAARVVHVQGASTGKRPYRMIVEHHRSLLRYAARTSRGIARLTLPLVAVALAVRTVVACLHRVLLAARTR